MNFLLRRPILWSLAVAGIFSLVSYSALAKDKLVQTDLFVGHHDGYHTYRIPSLLVTKKGTVLALCEGRKNSKSDTGDIDILLKRSTNQGQTWSAQFVVWDDEGNTCGNPCPVVDEETGTIWLFLTHNMGADREKDIHLGIASASRTVWLTKSTDDGKSWSKPVDLTASVKDPSWAWYATGPGVGIQLQNGPHRGRLVVPCDHSYRTEKGTVGGSHVIFSDDHGQTWRIGGVVRPGMNECQVVELADGQGGMLLSMRNHPQGGQRAESISHDGGLTWATPTHNAQLIDPVCQASILRYSWPDKKHPGRILYSNPSSAERRKNLTVRVSYDDGKLWPASQVLNEGPSAYSCLTVLPRKDVGCLYERGEKDASEKITFARFPLRWVEGVAK